MLHSLRREVESVRLALVSSPTEQIYNHNMISYHIISTSVHIYRLQSAKNINHGDCRRRIPHSCIYSREFFYTNVARKLYRSGENLERTEILSRRRAVAVRARPISASIFGWRDLQVRPSLTAFAESCEPTLSRLLTNMIPLSILFHVFKSRLSPYSPQA